MAAKPDGLSLVPESHMVEGENSFKLPSDLHSEMTYMNPCMGREKVMLLEQAQGRTRCVSIYVYVVCMGHRSISGATPQLKITFKKQKEPGDYHCQTLSLP